jgi:aminopeptidase N
LSQGWPGLVFLSSYAFLTDAERQHMRLDPVQSILSSQVLVHEIAHQWWGDSIAWRGYRDQWWVEALANYSSLMMLEENNPAQFRAVLTRYRDNLFEKNKNDDLLKDAGPVTFGGRLSSSRFPDGYEAISYGRGTWLFHMLRSMLREGATHAGGAEQDPFLTGLRRLREKYQGKLITTEELISVFEGDLPAGLRYEGKTSLEWFVSSWIQGTAVPKLQLQGMKYAARDGSVVVTGKILQTEAPNDQVTCVPLYGQRGNNAKLVFLGQVFADGPETTFRLSAPQGTSKILLDPNQTLLTAK